MSNIKPAGYYVETYGGNRYTSIAWYPKLETAERHKKRLIDIGSWSGMPPRITTNCTRCGGVREVFKICLSRYCPPGSGELK